MYNMVFDGDYTAQFAEAVDYLFDERLKHADGTFIPHIIRIDLSDALVESFVYQTGKRPPSAQLERLATYIIKEDKKARKDFTLPEPLEFPFLSDSQFRSRYSREKDWAYAQTVDTNGVNKVLPTRTNRIADEMARGMVKLPIASTYGVKNN